jgi:hypothetical protein
MSGIQATKRTVKAIQEADKLAKVTSIKRTGLLSYSGQVGLSYNGMFKATNTSDETDLKISIVDGFDSDATDCGIATISDTTRNIPVTEVTVTASGVIILETSRSINN